MIRELGFAVLALSLAAASGAQSPQAATPAPAPQAPANPSTAELLSPKGTFAGNQACRVCHPDVWLTFYKNPHFKSIASGKEAPENTGCEGCHGPGGDHVRAHGSKATIVAFSELTPKQTIETCLRCHAKSLERANIHSSPHTLNDVSCTQCHSVHKSATPQFLLAKAQPALCYQCHPNLKAEFSMPFKHRVNEGFMKCSDCHNPHGTFAPTWRIADRPSLVGQGLANEEACLKCHVDKKGPFAFEHPPVRVEGCEACHYPHGSTNSRLLRRPVVFTMCLECHNGSGAGGRSGLGVPSLSPAHNMADPRYRNCTNCHVRIHGSNSDSLFLR
jgi:DmsE family decaheme c-type cytochrome